MGFHLRVDDVEAASPYPHAVAADDEFRRVAEDVRALARSLGRDFRETVDQAMRGGHGPGGAVRQGLKGLRDDARRGFQTGFPPAYRRGRPGWGTEGPVGLRTPPTRMGRGARGAPPVVRLRPRPQHHRAVRGHRPPAASRPDIVTRGRACLPYVTGGTPPPWPVCSPFSSAWPG